MRPLKGRCFVFLLGLYLVLVFANPLMPGAVQFMDGSVDVVHANRVRPKSVPVDTALTHVPAHGQPEVLLRSPLHTPPMTRDRRDHFTPLRRPPHAPSDSGPSSEDH